MGAGLLGPSHQGVGEQALVAAVLGTGAAQEQLIPALMKAYAAADYVVGLDVDKDKFDKFGMRHCIDLILLELWKDAGQRLTLVLLCLVSCHLMWVLGVPLPHLGEVWRQQCWTEPLCSGAYAQPSPPPPAPHTHGTMILC